MRRLSRVLAERAANLIELLGLAIPRLEFLVGERPGRRNAVEMLHLLEILAPVTNEDRAVEFRIAADIVVVARIEAGTALFVPGLPRAKVAALEDRSLIAVFR